MRAATESGIIIAALAAFPPLFRPILRTFDLGFSELSIMKNDWEKFNGAWRCIFFPLDPTVSSYSSSVLVILKLGRYIDRIPAIVFDITTDT